MTESRSATAFQEGSPEGGRDGFQRSRRRHLGMMDTFIVHCLDCGGGLVGVASCIL